MGGLITRLLAEFDCRCSACPAWDLPISSTTRTEASERGARSTSGTDRVRYLELRITTWACHTDRTTSDEPRQAVNWIPQGPDGESSGTRRLRIEQPLESMK